MVAPAPVARGSRTVSDRKRRTGSAGKMLAGRMLVGIRMMPGELAGWLIVLALLCAASLLHWYGVY